MLLIGHRGCHYSGYNQNTIRAFAKVIEEGVAAVEFDVQLSLDKHLVVIHNLDLKEVSTGMGLVCKTDVKTLRTLYAGAPQSGKDRIPILSEVFDLFAKISKEKRPKLHMELKGDGSGNPAGLLAKEYIAAGRLRLEDFLVSSFNWDELREIRNILPGVDIALLDGAIHRSRLLAKIIGRFEERGNIILKGAVQEKVESYFTKIFSYGCEDYMLPRSAVVEDSLRFLTDECPDSELQEVIAEEISLCLEGGYYTEDLLNAACTMGAISVNLWCKTISREFVVEAHHKGLKVLAYTANSAEDLLNAARCEVDGIFTDYYMQAREVLAEN